MAETTDLSLITYVVRIRLHVKLCAMVGVDFDPNNVYYHAIKREENDFIQVNNVVMRITDDLALAEIYESGARAQKFSKALTISERTNATVHPVSRKIFFEASLKGLR